MPDPRIRPIAPADVPAVTQMVYDLADYERLRGECHLTPEQLHAALFGARPALFGLVATQSAGDTEYGIAGYALYFLNFSTWEGVHGIYLEDLYVRPDQRGSGLGKALLVALAEIAAEGGFARVEWSDPDGRLDGLPAHWSGSGANGAGKRLIHSLAGRLTSRPPVTTPTRISRMPQIS